MISGHIGIVILFIVIAAFGIYIQSNPEVSLVKSSVDGNTYLVRDTPDKKRAADMLGRVNMSIQKLITHLASEFPDEEITRNLKKNWNPSNITELSHTKGKTTSYTINKTSMVVCLRDKTTEDLEKFNTVMFVVIHEAAHMAVPIDPATGRPHEGHGKIFWTTMKFLLQESIRIGIYTYQDFGESPESYCGIDITDTPHKI